ncbi:hypothetical protein NSB25_24355 [Acetatifactor muris]|uniref:Uncharacterized protein n=1 Tax=Acetatifactor muris TaxID=879566 RepID=A0A2K4ZNP2_9FIRM|nr:hypothetical protein [Acetatifactor muris]MCR2050379.1 hypothetical protein [Acetatifactor muris]SOY32046.1 hypothetical protein AMURIS_04799 [Acetatifactor muris]
MRHNESEHPSLKDAFFNVKGKLFLWSLNNFIAKEDEYYGFVKPSPEWMTLHNKKFWIQPCNEEETR